jgi:hypothetical protein
MDGFTLHKGTRLRDARRDAGVSIGAWLDGLIVALSGCCNVSVRCAAKFND